MNHASNKPAAPEDAERGLCGAEHAPRVAAIWRGALGVTVRCVPERRVLMAAEQAPVLYAKLHLGPARWAAAEWRWLHVLPLLGVAAPRPVAWVGRGRRSLVVTEAVRGRSLDAWAIDAARDGWLPALLRYTAEVVAPWVRSLHDRGIVHRDLNAAHLYSENPRHGTAPPILIDVERMFEPRWARRRWRVKDLASLIASAPVPVPLRDRLRFLRNYCGGGLGGQRTLMGAIRRKEARIGRHRPRFG